MALFLSNHDDLNNLGRGSPKKLLLNFIEIRPGVSDKIFKVFYIDIQEDHDGPISLT